ncbi:unnamed protein product [Pleuronectes platessa]|uniref:Uncharacterized protein n=1 Tax=Pleuronectes platessa TaxID=8262 RepID=A0A9N7TYU6_PLEPL|nr:unnamed protein product [Pleuronectes platessa]
MSDDKQRRTKSEPLINRSTFLHFKPSPRFQGNGDVTWFNAESSSHDSNSCTRLPESGSAALKLASVIGSALGGMWEPYLAACFASIPCSLLRGNSSGGLQAGCSGHVKWH